MDGRFCVLFLLQCHTFRLLPIVHLDLLVPNGGWNLMSKSMPRPRRVSTTFCCRSLNGWFISDGFISLDFYQKLAKPDKTFELGCGKPANQRLSGGDAVAEPPTLDDGFVCYVGFVT